MEFLQGGMKYIFTAFLLLLLSNAHSQTRKQFIKAADEAFENENYYFALQNYKTALEIDSSQSELLLNAAESARRMLGYTTSADLYKSYLDVVPVDSVHDVRAFFWYGLTLMNQGLYDSATHQFDTYLNLIDSNEVYFGQKARISLESCDFSKILLDNPLNVVIDTNLNEVNTPYSEFSPYILEGSLYYTSMAFQPAKKDPLINTNISKILSFDLESGDKTLLNEKVNHPNLLTSHAAFDEVNKMMYFTVCNYLSGARIDCDIFSSKYTEDGNFEASRKLPDNINLEGYTSTQPTVMLDPSDNRNYLVFVSNRPNGVGGLDIWKSEILGQNLFGTPQNLKEINTFDDEATPFYAKEQDKLYFATKGRPGLGEFDIFQADYKNGKWSDIRNIGYPVNSSTNDLYPYILSNGREGYFSSNRPGSLLFYDEEEACCYDLYKFRAENNSQTIYLSTLMNTPLEIFIDPLDLSKPILSQVVEPMQGRSLQDPDSLLKKIYIPNNDFIGSDKISFTLCTDDGANFCDTINYVIEVREIPTEIHEFETKAFTKLSDCVPLIGFSELDSITIKPCDKGLKNGKIEYTVIDNKLCFEYMPDYGFLGLDEMCLEVCNSNPRDNCIRKILKFNVVEDNIEALLPVVLYFDNDQPTDNTSSISMNFIDLLDEYLSRKDEFISEYVTLLNGQERKVSKQEMNSFFDNVVADCQDDIKRFSTAIERYLDNGNEIEVYIKGFSSPRAEEGYNLDLASRRISSVVSYFMDSNDHNLKKYFDGGQLKILEKPIGEAESPDYVSDDLNDPRNSIFSIEASVERRVEIVEVKKR